MLGNNLNVVLINLSKVILLNWLRRDPIQILDKCREVEGINIKRLLTEINGMVYLKVFLRRQNRNTWSNKEITFYPKEMSSYNFVSQYLFTRRAAITPRDVISGQFKSKIVLKLYSSLITSSKIVSEKLKNKLLARFYVIFLLRQEWEAKNTFLKFKFLTARQLIIWINIWYLY